MGVSDRSVRLYAQAGRLPFRTTPGGHRRFDLDEVRTALLPEAPSVARPSAPPTLQQLRGYRHAIIASAKRHGAENVRVFGSVARGEATEDSDVDVLVQLAYGRTYADVEDLEAELQTIVGFAVDVLTEGACRGHLAHVLNEAVSL